MENQYIDGVRFSEGETFCEVVQRVANAVAFENEVLETGKWGSVEFGLSPTREEEKRGAWCWELTWRPVEGSCVDVGWGYTDSPMLGYVEAMAALMGSEDSIYHELEKTGSCKAAPDDPAYDDEAMFGPFEDRVAEAEAELAKPKPWK